MSNNIDDYIQQGMYGNKETKRAERKKFLGTIRERIVIALTQGQVRERGTYKQVEEAIKENRKAHMYLNGNINYADLSKYTKIASQYNVYYTIVTNIDYNSEIGLVLAYDYAIDKEEIYVEKEIPIPQTQEKRKTGLSALFSKLFKNG
ncbi:YueI family protein [Sporosarcina sp. Te-1]|uniref:YueI family protein n=1 Tax=Sporosarcina sp. Te-1 TaxID=2818390 RepID=UPI001A9EDEF6|nr:YueI family protein [Sporosarcina sp. Te-1]QTD43015.1 YueI family protein [Sporosarcina sp. Te-1]